jgi:tetratricopeptide (TPR) repeat protein
MGKMQPAPQSQAEQAMKAFRAGHLEEAITGFKAARDGFTAQNEPLKAAEAANNLCVALLKASRPEEALDSVKGTPEIFLAQQDDGRAAQATGNLASALEACGHLREAEEAYRKAVELFERSGDKAGRSQTLKALSRLSLRQGEPLQAISDMQGAVEAEKPRSFLSRLLRRMLRIPLDLLRR